MSKMVRTISDILNDTTFDDYYNRLSLLAMSLFEWTNLPNNISERYMEDKLFNEGQVLFFEDETLGFACLACMPSGTMNMYEEYTKYTATSIGYHEEYKSTECVLIRDNYLIYPPRKTIEQFALRLTDIERTIDININAQKTPIMIHGSQQQQLSLKNIYKEYEGNTPVLFADKSLDKESLKVLKTDAPYIADKLQNHKHQIMNEVLTFLGIDNANTDKKERLITSEVESNSENVSMSLESRLLTRKKACELINKKYGLNIDVKLRKEVEKEGGAEIE